MRDEQVRRYARHILLPDVGGLGQTALMVSAARIQLRESEPAWLPDYAVAEGRPANALGVIAIGCALAKELSGEAHLERAQQLALNCPCLEMKVDLLNERGERANDRGKVRFGGVVLGHHADLRRRPRAGGRMGVTNVLSDHRRGWRSSVGSSRWSRKIIQSRLRKGENLPEPSSFGAFH